MCAEVSGKTYASLITGVSAEFFWSITLSYIQEIPMTNENTESPGRLTIWISAALVFGALGWFMASASHSGGGLPLGYQQFIHARIPWLVLGCLWFGAVLGMVLLFRDRRWLHWAVVLCELPVAAFLSAYLLFLSFPPVTALALGEGDAFPGYELSDQSGRMHRLDAGEPREPALYIFYRGDW